MITSISKIARRLDRKKKKKRKQKKKIYKIQKELEKFSLHNPRCPTKQLLNHVYQERVLYIVEC